MQIRVGLALTFVLFACSPAEDARPHPSGTGGGGSGASGQGAITGGTMAVPTGGASGDNASGMAGVSGAMSMEERVFDAGNDPGRNDVQAGALCTRLAQIQCAGEAFCCAEPGRDRAACETAQRQGCIDGAFLDIVSNDAMTMFDPAIAAMVFTELERLASTCDVGVASFGASRDGLMRMFRGTVAQGESCMPTIIGPGGFPIPNPMPEPKDAATHLLSCSNIETVACLPKALAWTCAPRGEVGGGCFTDVNCVDGLYCPNPDFNTFDKTCTPRKGSGDPCSTANECSSLFCRGGQCVEASREVAYCLATQ